MSESHSNPRPIYIKKQNRKRYRSSDQRLHGAFTGGFSAGHFNTVGSLKGWKPSCIHDDADREKEEEGTSDFTPCLSSKNKRKLKGRKTNYEQKIEDFMDEEDANEWGGPMKVKGSYQTKSNTNNAQHNNEQHAHKSIITDSSALRNLLYQKRNKNDFSVDNSIGKQLLKVLGWRENLSTHDGNNNVSSYAYVPIDDDDNFQEETLLLSKKLKRIELQLSSQHTSNHIPPPKVDKYGMGFEPYKNAPEFKAHREMRKIRAQERARAGASSTTGENRMNVYKMSDLNVFDDNDNKSKRIGENKHAESLRNILAYETIEDFIGNTTSAGFALHDDDDHVYDKNEGHSASLFNKSEKSKINMNEYHNEVFECSDHEIEDGSFFGCDNDGNNASRQTNTKLSQTQQSTLQSFAGALKNWASDGAIEQQASKAVTSDGEAPLHGFELGGRSRETMKRYPGPDVPPNYVPAPHEFSHEDAISNMKVLTAIMKENIRSTKDVSTEKIQKKEPMAGGVFSSLSNSLKSRFITSTLKEPPKNDVKLDPRRIKVIRSTISWQPDNLLLKRFNVDRSSYINFQVQNPQIQFKSENDKTREEDFFEKDVLGRIDNKQRKEIHNYSSQLDQKELSTETMSIERPSLDFMKSIFEPSSDGDDSYSSESLEKTNSPTIEMVHNLDEEYNNNIKSSYGEKTKHNYDNASESSSSKKRKKKRKKSSHDRKKKKHKSKKKY